MDRNGHHSDDYGRCLESLIEVFLFIDGQLDEKRKNEINHHLEHCNKCYGRVEFERLLRNYVREKTVDTAPSPGLMAKITSILES